MKTSILKMAMIIAVLAAPCGIQAKGKPDRPVLLKDGNGVTIGRVIGMETVGWPYVITAQGYRTLFRTGTGMIFTDAAVYFESMDCTGDAYVGVRYVGTVFLPTSQDSLAYSVGAIAYSPHDAQSKNINTNSTLDSELNCVPFVTTREAYPAYPNDPDITGIQNTVYPTLMVIE